MIIDAEARLITFRVLYVGPPGSSKFLSLRMLQQAAPLADKRDIRTFHTERGRVLSLTWPPGETEELAGCRVGLEMVTDPGPSRSRATQQLLLRAADAVVFLPERGSPGGSRSIEWLEGLLRDLAKLGRTSESCPVLVQSYAEEQGREELQNVRTPEGWPSPEPFVVAGDTQQEVARVLKRLRRDLLDHFHGLEIALGPAEAERELHRRAVGMQRLGRPATDGSGGDLGGARWQTLPYWLIMIAAAVSALVITLFVKP